ncbi:MAG: 3D domain-containing protein [Myxococcota bacterium]|nr:3D domain-containing protein [Myxococcota bacterium]
MIRRPILSLAIATPLALLAVALVTATVTGWLATPQETKRELRYTSVVPLRSRAVQRAELLVRVRTDRLRGAQLRATEALLEDGTAHLERVRDEFERQCVWEHTEIDGRVTRTRFPFSCERPVRSTSRRVTSSAYYSPEPAQTRYATGSLEGDAHLNGNGVRTADGTAPAHGVLAAPSSYPFGTALHLEGYGLGRVHDRGGSIVSRGEVDRIDLWMGRGDEGLRRALDWGMREHVATVFVEGATHDIERVVDLTLDG